LLKQDKDYLTRQLSESANRSAYSEEKIQSLERQLDAAKLAREEMYEKYIQARCVVILYL
jgi:progesterone-induced-blocking factor 1